MSPTKTVLHVLFAAAVAAGGINALSAQVIAPDSHITVIFVQPERFTDVKRDMMDSERDRAQILGALQKFIRTHAGKYVHGDMQLMIRITDVDLAGDFEPWRRSASSEIRIVKNIYTPRIELEFVLTDIEGNVLKHGKRRISDPGFMFSGRIAFNDDELKYEKQLLREWIDSEFRKQKVRKETGA